MMFSWFVHRRVQVWVLLLLLRCIFIWRRLDTVVFCNGFFIPSTNNPSLEITWSNPLRPSNILNDFVSGAFGVCSEALTYIDCRESEHDLLI